ncbi:helix-turn-helix transcriptional regulator [Vibrio sp. Vb2853]|uniref:helix-turn-helix domain-containing protein n=1 Tax=unclassified Vibrio TaxID=2614977 RepID=UPI0029651C8F|nr:MULTISPECIES: helix-turn-helix transcriptional regulator [unclassified Vibrio]MDW1616837.1 helix-turn-helix transcriptional regulator [Vibrio sp. Vb2881]MDW1693640.1 helix-turn-helix transcriptional regulator [Vibrio sp. Vb2853]MDW1712349.1 helix-turn-helix transcriptional regulator [Vibrio sp. Vb2865]MDW1717470.1 helix-turn-helix transcriptional regulator [Vibrio sp. Vb2873]
MTDLWQIHSKTDVYFMSKIDPIVYVLRRYRENEGISQEKMSALTGISISTIQRIESGRTDMKLGQYRQYLRVLEMSDMDVSIDLFSHEFVSEKDVAAMARKFPLKVKRVLVKFLEELSEALKH